VFSRNESFAPAAFRFEKQHTSRRIRSCADCPLWALCRPMKLILYACLALPLSLLAQDGLPDKPYIYVEGKAEIEKSADMVTLRFNLVARNPDQVKANQEVQTRASKTLALLKEKKITESDIIAADLTSEPQFEDTDSGRNKGKLIGYKVTRVFSVKVRDLLVFPKLVDALFAIGGVEFSGIEAGLTKEKELQDEIWEKALVNAREQADRTVKAIGMKIDSVFAISPTSFPQIRTQIFGSGYGGTERVIVTGPPEYPLGPLTINQNVHIIFLISPAN
jgi:uncharacterized protein YggE